MGVNVNPRLLVRLLVGWGGVGWGVHAICTMLRESQGERAPLPGPSSVLSLVVLFWESNQQTLHWQEET